MHNQTSVQEGEFRLFDEGGHIQQVSAEVDHFAFFGLPRRFKLDEKALEAKFFELSRRLHPDFFQSAPVSERVRSLDASARLNDAYKTLRDPVHRAVYLVELEGGKLAENDSRPPADLLEEILEAQEAAAELRCCDRDEEVQELRRRIEAARSRFEALRDGQREALRDLGERWDRVAESGEEPPDEVVQKMRSILELRNYIENILRSLIEALETTS